MHAHVYHIDYGHTDIPVFELVKRCLNSNMNFIEFQCGSVLLYNRQKYVKRIEHRTLGYISTTSYFRVSDVFVLQTCWYFRHLCISDCILPPNLSPCCVHENVPISAPTSLLVPLDSFLLLKSLAPLFFVPSTTSYISDILCYHQPKLKNKPSGT